MSTSGEGGGKAFGGVHWHQPGTDGSACGELGPVTPAMGGVTCRACRDAIDLEIESIAEKAVAPWAEGTQPDLHGGYRVPMPPDDDGREATDAWSDARVEASAAVREALDTLNREFESACSLR